MRKQEFGLCYSSELDRRAPIGSLDRPGRDHACEVWHSAKVSPELLFGEKFASWAPDTRMHFGDAEIESTNVPPPVGVALGRVMSKPAIYGVLQGFVGTGRI